ncbi:MAG: type II secretion system protein GspE, partial [Enterobacterales bacterium]|nr:type II secretion system protein GspE [Enterobacterales bacterium]
MNQPRMNQLRIEQLCHQFGCVMIEADSHTIQIAGSHTVAPSKLVDAIKFASGKSVVWHVWRAAQLESAQQHHATVLTPPDSTGDDVKTKQLLEYIIQQAITRRASDIHLEPKRDGLSVRLRIDGVLQPLPLPSGSETLR